ncbi:MAG: hypothetical protein HDQ87_03120 [Clostridia bacterium]|nr:hypothetical protein [Clostridia bacterium]
MDDPYESLPMRTDSCDGIRDIGAGTAALMDKMRLVAVERVSESALCSRFNWAWEVYF